MLAPWVALFDLVSGKAYFLGVSWGKHGEVSRGTGLAFPFFRIMSVNIIIKGGGKSRRRSSEETAAIIAKHNQEAAVREKATYKDRSRRIRKAAEEIRGGKGAFRLESVMDARTYMRHEQDRPGCMADDTYRKELLKHNDEIDCR